jgi:hypothetical protein
MSLAEAAMEQQLALEVAADCENLPSGPRACPHARAGVAAYHAAATSAVVAISKEQVDAYPYRQHSFRCGRTRLPPPLPCA